MSTLQRAFTIALYALAVASWIGLRQRSRQRREPAETSPDTRTADGEEPRVRVSCESLGQGVQVVRFRGTYPDVMDTLLGRIPEQPPALPEDLDWRALPKYWGGCPHCRKRSLHGESLWLYQVVERTRERGDNTTTYIARCRGCHGLMRATVDHDD
jgi:hypothetical protein